MIALISFAFLSLSDNLKISKDFQSLELLFFVSSDHYLSLDIENNKG